jgi:hypothetical protein
LESFNGKSWPKSFKHHAILRASLSKKFGAAVPELESWLEKFASNTFMRQLSLREADVLCLHSYVLEQTSNTDFMSSGYCWDPCWSVGYAQKKNTQMSST